MPPAFTIEEQARRGAVRVVNARGRFDGATAAALEALLPRAEPCVLQLESIDYLSSAGIAGLVKLSSTRRLRIARPAACVRDVLSLAGIDRLLSIDEDVDAALGALSR